MAPAPFSMHGFSSMVFEPLLGIMVNIVKHMGDWNLITLKLIGSLILFELHTLLYNLRSNSNWIQAIPVAYQNFLLGPLVRLQNGR